VKRITVIESNIPIDLIIGLRDTFGLRRFIETGTCSGATTALAALAFPQVDTIEIVSSLYEDACERFRGCSHVRCHHGDTREWLRTLDIEAIEPALFYLDAHTPWDGCPIEVAYPLDEELRILGTLHSKHCIVIDDNAPENMRHALAGWIGEVFGSAQFCAIAPGPCDWKHWRLEATA